MGGNALKNCVTKRLDAQEYFKLERETLMLLRATYPTRMVEAIPAYRSKPDFGDMDVLLESDNLPAPVVPVLNAIFHPKEVVVNGSCVSFENQEFQTDLILTPKKIFDFALSYFSWNDCGNLEGRIAHKLGFSYGHDGLWLPLRDGDYMYDNIEVSVDHDAVIEFLGFSVDWRHAGFETLEEMFEYISQGQYFNPEIFAFDNRNHRSRVRDAKRPSYNKFLKWLSSHTFPSVYDWDGEKEKGGKKYKQRFVDRAEHFFPGTKQKIQEANERLAHSRVVREKFNGEMVTRLTGLEGKELGMFMAGFKHQCFDDFDKEILTVDVENLVLEYLAALNKK